MQKLDGVNIIIQRKVQNRRKTFGTTSTNAFDGLSLQMLQKMLRPVGSITYCSLLKTDFNKQKNLEKLVLFGNGIS